MTMVQRPGHLIGFATIKLPRPIMLIITALAVALLFIAFPNIVIQPYTAQNATALKVSLLMLHYQQAVEWICCGVAAVGLVLFLRSRPAGKSAGWKVAGTAAVFVVAGLSRIDIYEMLFHPLGKPAFQSIAETKLDGDEHVLAVNLGSARAYPVRALTYHHIVNDVIGGIPIAATY